MSQSSTLLHEQAQQAIQTKNYPLAHHNLLIILQQDPLFADAYFLLGIIASEHSQLTKALQLFIQAEKLSPHNIEYKACIAKAYSQVFQPIKAYSYLQRINQLLSQTTGSINNLSAYVLDTIGVTHSQIGLHEESKSFFELACQVKPTNSSYLFNFATALRFTGNFPLAIQYYQTAIQHNPYLYKAYSSLASLNVKQQQVCTTKLKKLLTDATNVDNKLHIAHALAKVYEAQKNYDECFAVLAKIKATKLQSLSTTLSDDVALFKAIQKQFSVDTTKKQLTPDKQPLTSIPNNEAIFIVGMPRTGTSLVDRILSNHADVTSAGELPNFSKLFKQFSHSKTEVTIDIDTLSKSTNINFEQLGNAYIESTRVLTGKTSKFIDKMPLNILYAGFIIQALPNAKIICLNRNPLDTVVSNYKQLFSSTMTEYNYAYDLKWTAEYYLLFQQLMTFWQRLFPQNFYIINYDNLVENTEHETQQLFNFCELDWQATYLDLSNNKAPIATPSTQQVRTSIHNKSVNYWRNFDKALTEVMPLFKST